VAVGAVFGGWLVLPKEGSAFFSMASDTGFNNCVLAKHFGTCRAVRVMAIGANHFTFCNGVMRDSFAVGTLLFVAGKTHFRLRFFVTNLIDR
jgi:hypothetical protein